MWLCGHAKCLGQKNVKTHFFKETVLFIACEHLGAPDWKTLRKLTFFIYAFLKTRNLLKLTTETENRTKCQAETKACVF